MLKCYLIENEWDTTSTGLMSQIQNWAKAMSLNSKKWLFLGAKSNVQNFMYLNMIDKLNSS